jgi:hypothetical protein
MVWTDEPQGGLAISTVVARPRTDPAEAEPGRSRVSRLAVPVAVVGLVASLAMIAWTWRHPDVFEPAPALAWGYTDQPVDRVLYFGVNLPANTRDGQEVTVRALTPQVGANTSVATISFFTCTLAGTGPVSAVRDVNVPCADVSRLGPGSSFETGPDRQLVMSVQPTRPGRVEVSGVRLDFSQGWQRGTATFGNRVAIETVGRRG